MKKTIYILTALICATVVLPGCKKYFDLKDNPNQVINPPITTLLSTTTQKTGLNSQRAAAITSYFVQYLANPTAGSSTDIYQATDYSSTWDYLYFAMSDIYDMKQAAVAAGSSQHVGVADVMMAYHLTLITDMFGAGPYSNAFTTSTLTPKYDTEQDLYNQEITLLNEAITELAKTDSKLTLSKTDDLIYGGSTASWTKFAYALKARLLNKISKKSTYNAAAVLDALSKSFTSNADDAKMGVFLLNNPWADVATNNANLNLGGWLSEQLVDALNGKTYGLADPRIAYITDKTVNGTYVGTPNGAGNVGPGTNTVKDESYISLNSPLTGKKSPLLIATYSEMKFIEAEAALRSNDRARAYTAYLAGIKANMDKLGVSTADQTAYLANTTLVSVGSAALTLDNIFREKYVATYLNPETWVDARRYDYKYKDFTLPVGAQLSKFIRRAAYPDAERSKNGNNVPATTSLDTPLWWDQP